MHYDVATSAERDALIKELTGGQRLHGVGSTYSLPFATFDESGLTEIWACERGDLKEIIATIRVGGSLPVSRLSMATYDHMAARAWACEQSGNIDAARNIMQFAVALR